VLLCSALLLTALLPSPPAVPAELMGWTRTHDARIAFFDELLFFAIVCLMPAIVVLYRALKRKNPVAALVGSRPLA